MKVRLEQRLVQLKDEFASGQKLLAELESKQATLRETLLRISGAIQVLEEELAAVGEAPADPLKATNSALDAAGISDISAAHSKEEQ